LLDRGLKLDESIREAVLLEASEWGREEVVQRLLDRGARLDDSKVEAAIRVASERGHGRVVLLLQKHSMSSSR
jgi:hypothetical protein